MAVIVRAQVIVIPCKSKEVGFLDLMDAKRDERHPSNLVSLYRRLIIFRQSNMETRYVVMIA